MQVHIFSLLPMVFLLPSGTWAGEIVGGHEAEPHSRPYMAYLDIQDEDEDMGIMKSSCGGFLVAEDFVLTAAHCDGESITVKLGAHDISQQERSQQVIPVQRQIPHPQYDKETINNDIMLLQLMRKVDENDDVGIIELPDAKEKVKPGFKCTVAGWGSVNPDAPFFPNALREVDVVVMSDGKCPKKRNWLYAHYNSSTMMCVGDPSSMNDSSQGDSGGPLVCGGKAQGIVSWGPDKAPGVYTRVSTFVPWIKKTMKRLRERPQL
ncbi:mast cell protease 3-like [Pelodiscus sinensis]|uniref:mast cell protease 3-like n=1 Tax=Pelodiscus sinensis TaxID=13735 RepID=UPI003F6AD686